MAIDREWLACLFDDAAERVDGDPIIDADKHGCPARHEGNPCVLTYPHREADCWWPSPGDHSYRAPDLSDAARAAAWRELRILRQARHVLAVEIERHQRSFRVCGDCGLGVGECECIPF